jgi:membrane associated rhomboid family serine protease
MIPLRDVIPSRTFPIVTVTLIGVNSVIYLFQQSLTATEHSALIHTYGLEPASFAWWSPITSIFLHRDWLQFASNMLMLWLFGENLEDRMGRLRYVVFYLGCGVTAATVHLSTQTNSMGPAVGASGAVAGILGGYFLMYPRSRILALVPVPVVWSVIELPALAFLAVWISAQLVSGLLPLAGLPPIERFSFGPCAAGFLTGALLIRIFKRAERMRVEWWHDQLETGGRGPTPKKP